MALTRQLNGIPDGAAGVAATLQEMTRITRDAKTSLFVRQLAARVVKGVAEKDFVSEGAAIHAWVRDNIRYLRDVNGIETLQTPDVTLSKGYGDCDDKSMLVAAMLESVGLPTRFVAIAKHADQFCHVLVETLIGNKWVTVETTEPVGFGWAPIGVSSRMVMNNF